jgi:hypothetical protein
MPISIEKINEIYQNGTIDDNEKERLLFNHLYSNFSFGQFNSSGYDTKAEYITDLNTIKENSELQPNVKKYIYELIWWLNHPGVDKEYKEYNEFPLTIESLQRKNSEFERKTRFNNPDLDGKFDRNYKKPEEEKYEYNRNIWEGEDAQSDDDEGEMQTAYDESQVKESPQLPPGWKEKWSKSHKKPYYVFKNKDGTKISQWIFPTEGGSSNKNKNSNRKSHTQKSTKKIKRSKKAKNGKRRTLRKR